MKNYKLMLAFVLLGGATAFAQAPATDSSSGPGLIGKRYFGAGLTWEHFHSSRYTDAEGVSALVNLPVAPGFDATLAYDFSHLMGPDYSRPEHVFGASMLAYSQDEYGKPFFTAGLTEVMQRPRMDGVLTEHNDTAWTMGAGLESTFDDTLAVTYRIDYTDTFKSSPLNPTWKYTVQVNNWFTPTVGGVAAVSYNQIKHEPDSFLYTLGVRVRF